MCSPQGRTTPGRKVQQYHRTRHQRQEDGKPESKSMTQDLAAQQVTAESWQGEGGTYGQQA